MLRNLELTPHPLAAPAGASRLSHASLVSCGSCAKNLTLLTPCGSIATICGESGQIIPKAKPEYAGVFDIFKPGMGPSSSHTMGPMNAGNAFVKALIDQQLYHAVTSIHVHLYGSLALTGKGHATDRAAILGLAGFIAATTDPDEAEREYGRILSDRSLDLGRLGHVIDFDHNQCIVFHYDEELPHHPNGMTIIARGCNFGKGDVDLGHANALAMGIATVLLEETYYSVGGGFVKTEAEMLGELPLSMTTPSTTASSGMRSIGPGLGDKMLSSQLTTPSMIVPEDQPVELLSEDSCRQESSLVDLLPYPFNSCDALLRIAERENKTIGEVMLENEAVYLQIPLAEVIQKVDELATIFDEAVERGMRQEGKMPVSGIPRRAANMRKRLMARAEAACQDPLIITDWITLYARAVSEENACGGRVVTSPTFGAAGTLPAVLTYYRRLVPGSTTEGLREFLATAAAIGSLCKRNASISGAEAGCQAEVGSACAMAAAGLCAALKGTPRQVENAAEIALEHCLGMTCDPVMGLVQIPCIERNCVAAVKAVTACRLAMCGDGDHEVSFDSCVDTMYHTGLDMQTKYRETSTGGLAVFARRRNEAPRKISSFATFH